MARQRHDFAITQRDNIRRVRRIRYQGHFTNRFTRMNYAQGSRLAVDRPVQGGQLSGAQPVELICGLSGSKEGSPAREREGDGVAIVQSPLEQAAEGRDGWCCVQIVHDYSNLATHARVAHPQGSRQH
jgi:hypothetical protein